MSKLSIIDYWLIYPDFRKGENRTIRRLCRNARHASHEACKNIETAICLAKLRFKVRLLPITDMPGVKNPDAYLIEEEIIIELKHNTTLTASAIENELRDAKKQANYVLLHINSNLTKGALIRGLRACIHRAVNILEVWLIYRGGLFCFIPEEVRNETIEYKIQ